MTQLDGLAGEISQLSISHQKVENNEQWEEVLKSHDPGFDYSLTKVLVFKPKTPKSQTPVPLVLVSLNSTKAPSGVLAKAAGVKEPRLASPELVAEFFGGAATSDICALSIKKEHVSKIKLVVDAKISQENKVAIHTQTSADTAFIPGGQLLDYYASIGVEPIVVDFEAEASAPAAPSVTNANPPPSGKIEGAALIGITSDKDLDFPGWYQQVLTKGEMLEYYDVSGCYIMRPASFHVWETIQTYFNEKIKSIGVRNCSFPMFVSSRVLEREKDHIEGFAPEVAWVTKAGSSDLEEPVAIRPTSETVMYPYYAKWIRSHRDLPLRLNQWNSVVRWEFKHPQPFLRTREFLWQEGHTAHLTYESSYEETIQILEWYAKIYKELLAVPVVKGYKTDKERFAGSKFTTTVEGYIPTTGRGIQGATSHCLGQNFSKMFNIAVENPEGPDKPKINVWQNSWGLSTRVIGVMVMVHSDNKGLVMPPRVAETQTVVIPCGITAKTSAEDRKAVAEGSEKIEKTLADAGIRVTGDYRDNYSPGWKFSDWELRGVPLRVEFGPADVKKSQITAVRRDTGEKIAIPLDQIATKVPELLDTIQNDLYTKAKKSYDDHVIEVNSIEEFVPNMNKKNLLIAPFCGLEECEDDIKERTTQTEGDEDYDERAPSMGAKSLCIPFHKDKPAEGVKCVGCGKQANYYTQFGRSY
ncbi:hypothetical protein TRICI_004790 [Trichomonascus ciferrii]|uniref:proline--tRNA ligase n=1 Tax=Trichomonascus ciferrii TaxID=44093 RepID=A0A642UZE3_9ASCO|nr:hypothetical protein TRICI_004790 [Trichomonascus ciferrii]